MALSVLQTGVDKCAYKADDETWLCFQRTTAEPEILASYYTHYSRTAGVIGRTRPAGGGMQILPPCLTRKRMVVERRKKRQTNALNKSNLRNTKNFASRGQRSAQGQVKGQNYRFPHCWLPPTDPNWRSADRRFSPRTRPEVSKTRCRLKTLCIMQRSTSRSGQVTKGHLLDR